ncbi:MAG: peptidyl-prolyl cis-trans isomerase [Nitrospirota bacterium]
MIKKKFITYEGTSRSPAFSQTINRAFWAAAVFFLITASSYGMTVDRILATVNNDAITLADYNRYVRDVTGTAGNGNDVDETFLKGLIEEKIILHEARRKGIEVSSGEVDNEMRLFVEESGMTQEDLKDLLEEEGMSFEDYRRRTEDKIKVLKLIGMSVDSKIIVKDKEVETFYEKNKENYIDIPETVSVRGMFLKLGSGASLTEITELKRKALKISSLLKDGGNFEMLIGEYSDEPLKRQGGILGEFAKGELVPALDEKAFSIKKGEISGPLWVNDGVYFIQVVSRKDKSYKPFKEVKDQIYGYLYSQKREKVFEEWVKTLWERASVKIKSD